MALTHLIQGQQEITSSLELLMADQVKSSQALHLHAHS